MTIPRSCRDLGCPEYVDEQEGTEVSTIYR